MNESVPLTEKKSKKIRAAGPGYPREPLGRAVELTRRLWLEERARPTTLAQIATHWEFPKTNSAFHRSIETAKMFGLLEEVGASEPRQLQVSWLAQRILEPQQGEATASALSEAALRPPIHFRLWNHFHTKSPTFSDLEQYVRTEYACGPTAAPELINLYLVTLHFAKLDIGLSGSPFVRPGDYNPMDELHLARQASRTSA